MVYHDFPKSFQYVIMNSGADFSHCKKYRYRLWRIWDDTLPLIMVIGLNPSTADEINDDNTVRNVGKMVKHNGYGGFYMMNSFPFISTDPKQLTDLSNNDANDIFLLSTSTICKDVLFAWGSFKVMKETGRDKELMEMFSSALVINKNKDGSPKHPLYLSSKTIFINI